MDKLSGRSDTRDELTDFLKEAMKRGCLTAGPSVKANCIGKNLNREKRDSMLPRFSLFKHFHDEASTSKAGQMSERTKIQDAGRQEV